MWKSCMNSTERQELLLHHCKHAAAATIPRRFYATWSKIERRSSRMHEAKMCVSIITEYLKLFYLSGDEAAGCMKQKCAFLS